MSEKNCNLFHLYFYFTKVITRLLRDQILSFVFAKLLLIVMKLLVDEVKYVPETNQNKTDGSSKISRLLTEDSIDDDEDKNTEDDDKSITLNGFKYNTDETILLSDIDAKLKVFITITILYVYIVYRVIYRNFPHSIQI